MQLINKHVNEFFSQDFDENKEIISHGLARMITDKEEFIKNYNNHQCHCEPRTHFGAWQSLFIKAMCLCILYFLINRMLNKWRSPRRSDPILISSSFGELLRSRDSSRWQFYELTFYWALVFTLPWSVNRDLH